MQMNSSCALPAAIIADCCNVMLHGPAGNPWCFEQRSQQGVAAAETFHSCCHPLQARWHSTPFSAQGSKCFHEFWTNASSFLWLSGRAIEVSQYAAAQASESKHVQQRSHRPNWIAEFRRATRYFDACRAMRARYTLVELEVVGRNVYYRFGLCTPKSCQGMAAKMLAYHVVAERQHESIVATIAAVNLTVVDAARWSDLKLDWVIAGFMKCGSTTLASHLGLSDHGQLVIPAAEGFGDLELEAFTWRSLLSNDWVRKFNARVASLRHGLDVRVQSGLKNPWYIWNPFLLYALSTISDLRLLLIVRDPVDALSSVYFHYFAGQRPHDRPAFATCAVKLRHDCFSIGSSWCINEKTCIKLSLSWLDAYRMASHSRRAIDYFGLSRVYVLHGDSLATDPIKTLGRIASWLGVRPFGRSSIFKTKNRFGSRYWFNTRGTAGLYNQSGKDLLLWRQREKVCAPRNAHAAQVLMKEMRHEYIGLRRILNTMGESIPARMRRGRTRCIR